MFLMLRNEMLRYGLLNGYYQKDDFLRNYILLTSKQLVLLRKHFNQSAIRIMPRDKDLDGTY